MTQRFAPTKEKGYFRDTKTNAVVNMDSDGYKAFVSQRNRALQAAALEEKVASMSEEMGELKTMMAKLLDAIQSKS